jgi:hypothetical protein
LPKLGKFFEGSYKIEKVMMRYFAKHLQHYLPLLGILLVGIVGFRLFWYDKNFQIAIVIGVAAGYLTWGIIHHHIHKDLYLSVLLEYVAISLLGAVIILSLVLTA